MTGQYRALPLKGKVMDGLRAYREDELEAGDLCLGQFAVDTDDRRMHVRAYDHWVSILRGRACPSLEDLEPAGVAGPRQVLLDLRTNPRDPELTCIGGALIGECGARNIRRLSEIPRGSFLALLTAHYRHAALSRQPIAFEGEHVSLRGNDSFYRGVLLPLSSDGHDVDFVYGAISWREGAERALAAGIEAEVGRSEALLDRAVPLRPERAVTA